MDASPSTFLYVLDGRQWNPDFFLLKSLLFYYNKQEKNNQATVV